MIAWAMMGGALGTAARYLIGTWLAGWAGSSFPWATLAVNVVGSFALGLVAQAAPASAEARAFLAVGLCGGFTTFSTFSFEAVGLIQAGGWLRAGAYIGSSVVLGVLGLVGGVATARALLGP